MSPQEPNGQKGPIDPKSLLLPKKEGPSVDSAQRINAGALLEQEQHARAEGIAPKPEEQQPAAAEPAAAPAAAPKEELLVKPLQTYSADISQAVEGGASMVSIVAAEAARRGKTPEPEASPEAAARSYSWFLIGAGVLLLIAAIGVVTFIFVRPGGAGAPTEYQAPFIAVDDVVNVPATAATERDILMQALNKAREGVSLSVGLIAQLFVGVPESGAQPAQEYPPQLLLPVLAPNIPQDLLRTIEPAYLLGVHSYDENQAFLILRVDSYQQAYSGLLQWEGTMRGELLPLFLRTPPISEASASSSATSTVPLTRTTFSDQVVSNHDARVLLNPDNEILLLWTFLNRNTAVITTNESTLNEIIRRATVAPVIPQP